MHRILILFIAFSIIIGGLVTITGNVVTAETYENFHYQIINGGNAVEITGCSGLNNDIVVPDSIEGIPVTIIGEHAFAECRLIHSIILPNTLKHIGENAFYGCANITTLTIPNGVESIGDFAFGNCRALTTCTIGSNVSLIGSDAFHYCRSLINIFVDDDNSIYSDIDGVLLCDNNTNLVQYPIGRTGVYTIPDCVSIIGYRAFYYSTLTSIILSDNITRIEQFSFSSCFSLISVMIPSKVNYLGDFAFVLCKNLTSVTIEYGLTEIGSHAFIGCISLSSVMLPDSLEFISGHVFQGCSNLTSIVIPDKVTHIGEGAFSDCTLLTNLVLSQNLIHIEAGAFSGCTNLTSLLIPDNVMYIHTGAFYRCTSLVTVTIPNMITFVGEESFKDCISLTTVIIGDNVLTIGNGAFCGCTQLSTVIFKGNSPSSLGDNWVTRNYELIIYFYENTTGFNSTNWEYVNLCQLGPTPTAPNGLKAIVQNGCVTLNWSEPSYIGDAAIDSYLIYQDGIYIGASTSTNISIQNLTIGQLYSYSIAAKNAMGIGALSVPISVIPCNVAGIPLNFNYERDGNIVILHWDAPIDDGGSVIDHYIIYQDGVQITTTTNTSITVINLVRGQSYNFTVAAHNSAGVGNTSIGIVVDIPDDSDNFEMVPGLVAIFSLGVILLIFYKYLKNKDGVE